MIVTTMNDIPGYGVDEVYGEVMGLTVRSRNIGSQIGAGLKSILGGELKGMTKALIDSRQQVMERMIEEAEGKGANAIIAMRFDTSEMGGQYACTRPDRSGHVRCQAPDMSKSANAGREMPATEVGRVLSGHDRCLAPVVAPRDPSGGLEATEQGEELVGRADDEVGSVEQHGRRLG